MVNVYETPTMLQAIAQKPPVVSFLRNRYFPTNPQVDIFLTEDVLIDIKEGNSKMAPIVMPRKKGITVAREGFRTERWSPPLVAPQRPLTIDDLSSRGFGEALFAGKTPEQREAALLGQDLADLDELHVNREEYIAAQCMLNNGYILVRYADEYGKMGNEFEIKFYEGDDNPNKFTPTTPWNNANADIVGDLGVMVRMLTKKGNSAQDFIGDPALIDAIINNEKVQKMLDNRSMQMGQIEPEEFEGASYYGRISAGGRTINLFSYDKEFEDDQTKEVKPLFGTGQGVLTAPGAGRGLYGAISQIEESDRKFHTYGAQRVPKSITDVGGDTRTVRVASKPLFVPKSVGPWVSGKFFV